MKMRARRRTRIRTAWWARTLTIVFTAAVNRIVIRMLDRVFELARAYNERDRGRLAR